MGKRSNLNERIPTVEEVMMVIKEVYEQKKRGLAQQELLENTGGEFDFIDFQQKETNFYIFAKKIARKLNERGKHGFFKKVKKLLPQRLKFKKII